MAEEQGVLRSYEYEIANYVPSMKASRSSAGNPMERYPRWAASCKNAIF